jgi:hypothetical protein
LEVGRWQGFPLVGSRLAPLALPCHSSGVQPQFHGTSSVQILLLLDVALEAIIKRPLRFFLTALCLCLYISSSLAQFGPWVQVPSSIAAGSLATATVLPVNLVNGLPQYVSSFSIYLTASITANRLDLGPDFLQAQCRNFPQIPTFVKI